MPILYKMIQRENPTKRNEAPKWYPSVNSLAPIGTDKLADRIASRTTAQRADVYAVMSVLPQVIQQMMFEGYSVQLNNLGRFYCSLGSLGADTEKEFEPTYIKRLKVIYTPATTLKRYFTMKYLRENQLLKLFPEESKE